MITSLEEYIFASSKVESASDLLELYLRAVSAEGYQNAVFVTVRNQRLSSILWTRLPAGYLGEYKSYGWDTIDPIVQYIHRAALSLGGLVCTSCIERPTKTIHRAMS
jgi:hypothetical protein